jgi:uncharacterized RDD family membrane protein YckC
VINGLPSPPVAHGEGTADGDRGTVLGGFTGADLSEPPVAYAGVVTRVIAIAVDALLIGGAALAAVGAVLLMFSVFAIAGRHHALAAVIGGVCLVVWVVSYFAVFWTTTGQTPGSRVMQIRVARANGSRLRPRHALLRLAWMVLSLPLFWGYAPILISARRRGVFDVFAGTVVTHSPPETEPGTADAVGGDLVSQRRVIAVLAPRGGVRRGSEGR